MTESATATMPANPTTALDPLEQLKARFPKVRPAIVVALHILQQDPDIALDDAKARAAMHGVRITAASMNAAKRLMQNSGGTTDSAPAPRARRRGPTPGKLRKPHSPAGASASQFDAEVEAAVRQLVAKVAAKANAEAERLRLAIRKSLAVLEGVLQGDA